MTDEDASGAGGVQPGPGGGDTAGRSPSSGAPSDRPVPVELDPEAGAVWRMLSESMFGGAGPVINAETLELIRSVDLTTREALLADRPFIEDVHTIDVDGARIDISVFTPENHRPGSAGIYWIHGGGMVTGRRYMAADALDVAMDTGAVVTSIEYRLAPEHPAPTPREDCTVGLRWFLDNATRFGVDPERVVLGGMSAGGGLAAATALWSRDNDGPTTAGVMLFCPMLDDRMTTVSSAQFGDDLLWTRESNEFGWTSLLGGRCGSDDVSVYEAPGRAVDLVGLPPVFVDVGSADIFRDEDVAFASNVWASGGHAELHVWPGGYHGYEGFAPTAALTVAAVEARRNWFRRVTAPSGG